MENIQDSLKKIMPKDSTTSKQTHCEKHGIELTFSTYNTPFGEHKSPPMCSMCQKEDMEEQEKRKIRDIQNHINTRLSNAMIAPRFKEKTFENYNPENDGQKKAIEVCNWFIEHWNRSVGLILIGGPGTGKNHLASALVKKFVAEKDKTALITEAIKIIRTIKESWKVSDKTETQVIKGFIEPDLLVIDELGVQFGSETERMYLTEIINDRYNYMKPTILIGNLSVDEIKKIVGERAFDRFREGGKIVIFDWQSHRAKVQ